ncbi:MAG TPA: serine/threonine-protein kinase [Polyangiaceae bacterium]|nr:serine/threonine-protein kinase [Polyangiaceae bacterium]
MASDAELAQRFHVSALIGDDYGVEQPLGEGAMGLVVRARHLAHGETVAIKFLHSELRHDALAVDRLLQESRALARIESEHVPRVIDVGMSFELGPYMVMEFIEGMSVGALLEREGRLSPTRAVEYILQVCEALAATHKVGIVHRDIKPDNLLIVRRGEIDTIKLVDFGICSVPLVTPGSPRESNVYGTPAYMAPERLCDDPSADHRADIWSIGVVLHELVTGRGLFDADTLGELCASILSDAPVALEPDDAVLPARLRAIIRRCVSRDPERRYQSVEHLVLALSPLASLETIFRWRPSGTFVRYAAPEVEPPAADARIEPARAASDVRRSRPTLARARERRATPAAHGVAARRSRPAIACGALLVIGVVAGLRLWLPLSDWRGAFSTAETSPMSLQP